MRVASRAGAGGGRGGAGAARARASPSLHVQLRLRVCCAGQATRASCGSAASTRRCTTARCCAGPAGPCPATPTRRCAGRARTRCWARARTATVLAAGDPVIVDLVGGHEGYLADQTRTFVARQRSPATCAPPTTWRSRSCARSRPSFGRARRPARCSNWPSRWPQQAGLGEHFMGIGAGRIRFLGHGVGMEIDELPVLAPGFDEPHGRGQRDCGRAQVRVPRARARSASRTCTPSRPTGSRRSTTAGEELIEVMSVRHPQSEEQQLLIEAVRTLARERIAPHAAEVDKRAEFPWEAVELLRENDVFALGFAPGVRRHRHRHADLPARRRGAELGRRHRRPGAGGAVAGRDRDRAGGLAGAEAALPAALGQRRVDRRLRADRGRLGLGRAGDAHDRPPRRRRLGDRRQQALHHQRRRRAHLRRVRPHGR